MKVYSKNSLEILKERVNLKRLIAHDLNTCLDSNEFECPFCKGGTCFVSPSKHIYQCFSCEAKGDAISYLMNTRLIAFDTACEILSFFFRTPLEEFKKTKPNEFLKKALNLPEDMPITEENIIKFMKGEL